MTLNINASTKRVIHLVFDVLFILLLIISAVAISLSCYSIYESGENPFTRESISAAFSKIAFLFYMLIVFVAVGLVLKVALPKDEKKSRTVPKHMTLNRLSSMVSFDTLAEGAKERVVKEKGIRRNLTVANSVLLLLGSIVALVFSLNPANFPAADANSEVLFGLTVFTLCLMPSAILSVVMSYVFDASYGREIEVYKNEVKGRAGSVPVAPTENGVKAFFKENKKELILGTRIAFLLVGAVFVVVGAFNGGLAAVLEKAINICSECIGLA